jgi:hypothetical protein
MTANAILKAAALLLLGAVLAACGGRNAIKNGTSEAGAVPGQYDLVLRADKDGNFDLEGATLNIEDLRSHIRYRNEPGNAPVRTILLRPGEKQKIQSQHIVALAGIARDLKIVAYVDDGEGHLKKIVVNDEL